MASTRTTKLIFLSAAHENLIELRDRDIHDERIDQARELIRQVVAEELVGQTADELGISLT